LRSNLSLWFLSLLIFITSPASAEVLVLIHGYHSSGIIWRSSGVIAGLQENGWIDAGDYPMHPLELPKSAHSKSLVTVTLPSEAPVAYQSLLLGQQLQNIRHAFPGEPLILVGHSAGGVVARYHLVIQPESGVRALITLASPHLGTAVAEIGTLASDSPLGAAAPLLGLNGINRSRGLYDDLIRERYGSMLHWLNRQPHPEIVWISLVRDSDQTVTDDLIVPVYSQDMRNIPALRGSAISYTVPGSHELSYSDGLLLADIIRHLVPNKQD
jgi:pimeloyl-ACP methyl ester carboxylesterase